MKKIYNIVFLILSVSSYAQVGINTTTPNSGTALDVAGKTNVTERIHIGGTNLNTAGNPGTTNQVIVSGGAAAAPVWEHKKLPDGYGETFSMTYMNSGFDTNGVQLGTDGSIEYPEGMALNSTTSCAAGDCWKVIPDLTHTFPIYKNANKANFTFQTTIQANTTGTLSYGCGLFLNDDPTDLDNNSKFKLVGVRLGAFYDAIAGDYKVFNMNVTLENLAGSAAGRNYRVKVACRGRVSGASLFAGRPRTLPADTNLNGDMSRSALNIFILESW